jgi:hypothetical protein
VRDLPAPAHRSTDLDPAGRSVRYANEGACVPWATIAAIERATRDAADRRAAAALGRRGGVTEAIGRLRRRVTALFGRTA